MANQFGEKIKQLREASQLLQRQVAGQLDIDTPLLSKIERGERIAKKEYVISLSNIFNINQAELLTLWLADKVYDIVKDEEVALKAMQVAEDEIKYQTGKTK